MPATGEALVFGKPQKGAIRIVSSVVSGNGNIRVTGGNPLGGGNTDAGHGRIRIDLIERAGLALSFDPTAAVSVGSFMVVFPDVVPRLDIIEVAGQASPEGTPGPVQVILPFNAPTSQMVKVQARDFAGVVPIEVVLTPDSGDRVVYPADIDMGGGNPA